MIEALYYSIVYSIVFACAIVYCTVESHRRRDAEREARRYFVALLQIRNLRDGSTAHRIAAEALAPRTGGEEK